MTLHVGKLYRVSSQTPICLFEIRDIKHKHFIRNRFLCPKDMFVVMAIENAYFDEKEAFSIVTLSKNGLFRVWAGEYDVTGTRRFTKVA